MQVCFKNASGVAALLVLLSGAGVQTAFAIEAGEIGGAKIKDLIDLKGLKPLKNSKRIAVPGFRVGFVTRNKVTATAEDWLGGMGGGKSSGARASMEVMLANVDFATMQSIANQAYADFLAKLKETGLEVVPAEKVKAAQAFQSLDLTESTEAKPYMKKGVSGSGMHLIVVSPSVLPLWWTNWDAGIGDKGPLSQGNYKALVKLMSELDAAIVYPTLSVDFSALQSSGKSKLAKRASVSAKASIYITPAATVYWSGDKNLAFSRITDGIGVDGNPGEFVTADKATNASTVKSLMNIGIDIGPARSKKNLVLEADPAGFSKMAIEALNGAAELYKLAVLEARK